MQIDVVFTWVNDRDPQWQEMYNNHISKITDYYHSSIASASRFQNRNELYYSIKSVIKYAPWIRHIFIVTNCNVPSHIAKLDKVRTVQHKEIFNDPACLPTFNSRAIECNLHRIKGLSEHYLYFNDDMFLCRPCDKNDFFPNKNQSNVFISRHKILTDESKFRPIDYGIKNAKSFLEKEFDIQINQKLEHAPYPIQKSLIIDLEQQLKDRFATTSRNRFRSKTDLPVSTTLHAYYSLAIKRAIATNQKCRYVDISNPLFPLLTHRLSPLRRGKYFSLCLNEVDSCPNWFSSTRDRYVSHLLKKLFMK